MCFVKFDIEITSTDFSLWESLRTCEKLAIRKVEISFAFESFHKIAVGRLQTWGEVASSKLLLSLPA